MLYQLSYCPVRTAKKFFHPTSLLYAMYVFFPNDNIYEPPYVLF
jgi:hypothetical protein